MDERSASAVIEKQLEILQHRRKAESCCLNWT